MGRISKNTKTSAQRVRSFEKHIQKIYLRQKTLFLQDSHGFKSGDDGLTDLVFKFLTGNNKGQIRF